MIEATSGWWSSPWFGPGLAMALGAVVAAVVADAAGRSLVARPRVWPLLVLGLRVLVGAVVGALAVLTVGQLVEPTAAARTGHPVGFGALLGAIGAAVSIVGELVLDVVRWGRDWLRSRREG